MMLVLAPTREASSQGLHMVLVLAPTREASSHNGRSTHL
jgi:hypothetical protein